APRRTAPPASSPSQTGPEHAHASRCRAPAAKDTHFTRCDQVNDLLIKAYFLLNILLIYLPFTVPPGRIFSPREQGATSREPPLG
ncbi:hypothetical protein V6E34_25415, partial [Serratia marcescens]|uniref:hypothetical protein n=1 Tax=Serratia marcescens TaxID=615 RepID=UPI002FD9B1C2